MKLTTKQRDALRMMQERYRKYGSNVECGVTYEESTHLDGGQPFIHWKTLVSLVDKGLAVYEYDVDGSACGATEAGMAVSL